MRLLFNFIYEILTSAKINPRQYTHAFFSKNKLGYTKNMKVKVINSNLEIMISFLIENQWGSYAKKSKSKIENIFFEQNEGLCEIL